MARFASQPEKSTFIAEYGHFYWPDGRTAYEVDRADGNGSRAATLRDARKLGLLPSVTTILRVAAVPALQNWIAEQLLLAGLTLPRLPDETEKTWLDRVRQDAKEQSRKAAERGEAIHAAIESSVKERTYDLFLGAHVAAARETLLAACGRQPWIAEASFANQLGFGGRVDLHSPEFVVDIKTREEPFPDTLYDEYCLQLAAYRHGLGLRGARCGILLVGRQVPTARFLEASEADLERGLEMFSCLLAYWKAANRYDPCRTSPPTAAPAAFAG